MVASVWTRHRGLAAIGGTAFGVIGIFLVLSTIRENKRAADAAHDANRPRIAFAMANWTVTDPEPEPGAAA